MSKVAPIRTAVFPVAGLGTRFLPATKASPKEMLTVVDKPLIQYAVEEAQACGIENFIFITSQGKTAIEDHFDVSPILEEALRSRGKAHELALISQAQMEAGRAIFIRQQRPMGLGHAVGCVSHIVGDQPFALILADDLILSDTPCLKQMIDLHREKDGANIVAVMDVPREHVNRYGILDISRDGGPWVQARNVVEKPTPAQAPSQTAIVGRYILSPAIFPILAKQTAGSGGEIQLTDAFNPLMKQIPMYGLRFEGQRFDCGTKEGWLEANLAFGYSRPDLRDHLIQAIHKHCGLGS